MATTPHSSRNLSTFSGMFGVQKVLQGRFPRLFEVRDLAVENHSGTVADLDPLFHRNTDSDRLDAVRVGDLYDFFGFGSGEENARGALVEKCDGEVRLGDKRTHEWARGTQECARHGEVDCGAYGVRAERGFSQRNGEAAIAQVVGGFGESGADDFS